MADAIAVVTGASGGLGSALCVLLAANGASLVLLDRSEEKSRAFAAQLDAARPGTVAGTFAVDLADHADISRCAARVAAAFPVIHALYNNAGVLTETLQFSKAGNELHFEVNTLAPLTLIDALHEPLKAAGGAIVVNTSAGLSLNAKTLDWDELVRPHTFSKLFGPYVRSKAALNVVTAALGAELASDRIVVRAADPGPTRTRLTSGAGTPLWMRLFAPLLPTPMKSARKLFDAGSAARFDGRTGIFLTGGKIRALPPAVAEAAFAGDFLRRCRERAASS